jgi:uncharacterized protein
MIKKLNQFMGINCTINTTEQCNLRCKYCYEINKRNKDIPLSYCYKFIDILLDNADKFFEEYELSKLGFLLEFIGGDALANVDLVDKIIKYTIYKLNIVDNENIRNYWTKHYRFGLSSNGTYFSDPKIREFCERYHNILELGVSIDGCPTLHDMNRIFNPELTGGKEIGSITTILKNWDWYCKWYPNKSISTKSTLSKCSIPYLLESIKFMYEDLGIYQINQNFIMENAHLNEDDYILFDKQMRECVEYVLDKRHELYWSMIDYDTFARHSLSTGGDWNEKGHCGSGFMPCLGINGNIYPCFRWAPHTQTICNSEPFVAGNVSEGITNFDAFRNVATGAYKCNCTKEERCRSCEYESACSYCIGGCYAEYGEFRRTTHICEITKLQCKWAKVYWNEYSKLEGSSMEFDETYQLDRVKPWSPRYLGTNKGD